MMVKCVSSVTLFRQLITVTAICKLASYYFEHRRESEEKGKGEEDEETKLGTEKMKMAYELC